MLLETKIEIEDWLNKYEVKKYKIIPNKEYGYVVDVDGCVDLFNRELQNIKVKFNIVKGFFDCGENRLISLEGCPEIVNGNFFCDKNNLVSIKGSPKIVEQSFNCSKNKLTSLEESTDKSVGCPEEISGSFYCEYNNLKLMNLKDLITKELKINHISLKDNPELNELQNINDFNEVIKILNIYQEKESINKSIEILDLSIKEKELNIVSKKIINKV